MFSRVFSVLFFLFSSGLFCQEIENNIDNSKIEKNDIQIKPLYQIGDIENNGLNILEPIFKDKNFEEVFNFFQKLPTKNKNYTSEMLVHKILKTRLSFKNDNISAEQDRLLFELRVNKLFEMGKFADIENFYVQLPPNLENEFINIKRIEAYLLRNEFRNACSLIKEEKIANTFKLGKFDIICSIITQEFEKARFNLELLKELNTPGDTLFIELAYKIMGDIEVSQKELAEKSLENISNLTPILLSYLQIAEISPTFKNIKDAPISSLIFILSSPTTSSEIKLYCAERLVKLKRISPNILAEVYQLSNFNSEEIENVLEIYKTLSPVRSRSLLYQSIIKEVDPEIKFQLIKLLLINAKKNKLFSSLSNILKDSINYSELRNLSISDKNLILDIFTVNSQFNEARMFIQSIGKDYEIMKKDLYINLIEKIDSDLPFIKTENKNYDFLDSKLSFDKFNNILILYSIKNKLNEDLLNILSIKESDFFEIEKNIKVTDFLSIMSLTNFSNFYLIKIFFKIIEGKDLNDLSSIEKYMVLKIIKIIGFEDLFKDIQAELIETSYD